jgi:hypothetical protein
MEFVGGPFDGHQFASLFSTIDALSNNEPDGCYRLRPWRSVNRQVIYETTRPVVATDREHKMQFAGWVTRG